MASSSTSPDELIDEGAHVGDAGSNKGPKRQTEKRKLQNRVAQRKYRENLKAKIEALEKAAAEQAKPTEIQFGTTRVHPSYTAIPDVGLPETEDSWAINFDAFPELASIPSLNSDTSTFPTPTTGFSEMDQITPDATEVLQDVNLLDTNFDIDLDFFVSQLPPLVPDSQPVQFSNLRNQVPLVNYFESMLQQEKAKVRASKTQSSTPHLNGFVTRPLPPRKVKPNLFKRPDRSAYSDAKWGSTISSDLIQQLRLDDTKENQSLVRTALARNYNFRDVFLAGLSALGKQNSGGPDVRSNLTDPKKNTLTLLPTSTLQAFLSIAVTMGLPIPEMHMKTYQSPFYQPEAVAKGDLNVMMATHSTMPSNLRPTVAQITHPHHPWVDIIPFPCIRERALTLSAMEPPMIDLYELKNDIFLNNGIFCWRTDGKGLAGTGQPWDRRSWEAEPWFLKKWYALIGGESGELWEQTKWWRVLRGLDGDIDWSET